MNSKSPSYHGDRFPPDIISHAVWIYLRFCMSFRDVEVLLTQRGVSRTETLLRWRRLARATSTWQYRLDP